MKNQWPRILMFLSVLALGGLFLFPLWEITLDAAQFPGGLKMHIWINKVGGEDKNIIQNINILNHYIGMQPIHPDSIPELNYFPIVVISMMVLGVVALLVHRTWAYLSWFLVMLVLGVLAIYDFYLWLYDYGHNLDPKAPIKIEGMTYMPPLFGEKDLLNFYVTSYPHWGGVAMALSILLAFLASLVRRRQRRRLKTAR